ncbi:MAG: hypothetical protein JXR37_02065 [Kiritimatiellae bacterium]|nr:hypothetical protein [Kiritimatiellia bacterium]
MLSSRILTFASRVVLSLTWVWAAGAGEDSGRLCLTGNAGASGPPNARLHGSYRYYRSGLAVPFVPDSGESTRENGPIPFAQGALTDGERSAVDPCKGCKKYGGPENFGAQGRDVVFDLGRKAT